MADYYPLLAKAVAGLAQSSADTRRAVYDRARKALIGQLRAIEPPIAEADIARESSALDEAVARLEGEIAARAAADYAANAAAVAEAVREERPVSAVPETDAAGPQPTRLSFRRKDRTAEEGEARSAEELPRLRETGRPLAPAPAEPRRANRRIWAFGAIVAAVVLAVAGAAITLRNKPEDLAQLKAPGGQPAEAPPQGKIGGRVGGPAPGETTTEAKTQQAQPAPVQAPLPVAHRAALLIEAPEVESKVKTFVGSVVWRLQSVARGPGQPLATAVSADVDIPEARLKVTLEIQKNMDGSLPATHTIEVRFTPQQGTDFPGVKQISNVQMRREEAAEGDPLAGVPVPITENFYLIGLARGDLEKRNLDLLRTRGWFDLPILMTNGRVAKLTLEKGASGARVIDDAIAAWDQQK